MSKIQIVNIFMNQKFKYIYILTFVQNFTFVHNIHSNHIRLALIRLLRLLVSAWTIFYHGFTFCWSISSFFHYGSLRARLYSSFTFGISTRRVWEKNTSFKINNNESECCHRFFWINYLMNFIINIYCWNTLHSSVVMSRQVMRLWFAALSQERTGKIFARSSVDPGISRLTIQRSRAAQSHSARKIWFHRFSIIWRRWRHL